MIHLHTHSIYSIRDSLCTPEGLAKKAKELGMDSLALTDHGTMAGIPFFIEACKEQGIKPIIGCEFYVASSSEDKERPRHLVLLAKNIQGYRNLLELSYRAAKEMFYYKPRILLDWLDDKATNLVCLTACISGIVAKEIELGDGIHFPQTDKLKELFGEDLYFEIQEGSSEVRARNKDIIKLAKKMNIQIVPTYDVHYIEKDDYDAHTTMYSLAFGNKNKERALHPHANFMADEATVKQDKELGKYMCNTHDVADKCHKINIKVREPYFNITDNDYQTVHDMCLETTKVDPEDKRYTERIYHELGVIKEIGCASFFMLLKEVTTTAKQMGIRVGRGRGSVCGSLVAYILGIHDVDPIENDLYFERFMNTKRISPPDIDIDIEDSKREALLERLVEKFGEDKIMPVSAYSYLKLRSAIRDVARAEGLEPKDVNTFMSKNITDDTDIEDLINKVRGNQWKNILNKVKNVTGTIRHSTVHASGFLIYDKPLWTIAPIHKVRGKLCVQYDKVAVDMINFPKVDILGLTTMSVIEDTLRNTPNKTELKMNQFNDSKVFDMMSRGETEGCFHIETEGAKRILLKAGVDEFNDLVMMLALDRPGVLGQGFFADFLKNKETGSFNAIPELREALGETHGVMIYQEQVMRIAQEVAGLNASQADMLRYSIGKKKIHIARKVKKEFLEGCKKRGMDDGVAQNIYDMIEASSTYLFNKAHATAYAQIAYQTAYLKKYHFKPFVLALLNNVKPQDKEKMPQYIGECSRTGIRILPPHVNVSKAKFVYEGDSIRFGLGRLANIGIGTAQMIEEAMDGKPVKSFGELCQRIPFANKKIMESLIYAGACFGLGEVPEMLAVARSEKKRAIEMTQGKLFTTSDVLNGDVENLERKRYEIIGMVLVSHTLQDIKKFIVQKTTVNALEASYSKMVNFVGMVIGAKYQKPYNRTVISLCGLQDKASLITKGDKTDSVKMGSIIEAYGKASMRRGFNIHITKVKEIKGE